MKHSSLTIFKKNDRGASGLPYMHGDCVLVPMYSTRIWKRAIVESVRLVTDRDVFGQKTLILKHFECGFLHISGEFNEQIRKRMEFVSIYVVRISTTWAATTPTTVLY